KIYACLLIFHCFTVRLRIRLFEHYVLTAPCFYYISYYFFFFNDTPPTEIYTLSLHDALPIFPRSRHRCPRPCRSNPKAGFHPCRSEEHTSELQSPCNLVCRLLLEKKNRPPGHEASFLRRRHYVFISSYTKRDIRPPCTRHPRA